MFTIDTTITDLKVRERNLFKVLFSMNIHQVATPELSAEDAKSYVFFFREGGRFLSYIGLYFLHSDRKLYYSHAANPFPESELPHVESEARSFAEDMGAMLDELDIAKLSDLERDRWIDEQDIFSTKKHADEQSAAVGVDQRKAAPAVQPAPVVPPVSPAPEVRVAPTEQGAPVQPVPPPQPIIQPEAPLAPMVRSMPEPAAQPLEQSQVQAPVSSPAAMPVAPVQQPVPSRPQRKQATTPRQPKAPEPVPEPAGSADEVLEQAVKAGIVKAPKQPLNKDIRNANGAVSRDKEALVRLLASF